jgi:hypothetical protein
MTIASPAGQRRLTPETQGRPGPGSAGQPEPGSAVLPGMPNGSVALPAGRLNYAMYPRLLLRGTGFPVGPLLAPAGTDPGTDHEQAVEQVLRTLRAAFRDPRLRQAVAQTNPGYYDIAFAPGQALVTGTGYHELTKHGRRQVRTAHRYLRRFLGKTETNSFFGPTLAATWEPELGIPLAVGAPGPEQCVTDLSHWVVLGFTARHRRATPPAHRCWRRDPLWRPEGTVLRNALHGRQVELTEAALAVWRNLEAPATPAVLLARMSLDAESVRAALTLLAPALRPWPEPPSTLIRGTDWLVAEGLADDAVTRVTALLGMAGSAWPRAHQVRQEIRNEIAAAGLDTARAAGRHYADRDVINEDRASPWNGRVRLGAAAVTAAQQMLGQVLPLFLLAALLRQADAREAVARHTGGAPAGLVELAAASIEPVTTRIARLHALLAGLVPDDPDMAEARIDPGELTERLRPLWAQVTVADDDQLAAIPGFDLMVEGGPPGRGRWILSECHDDSSSAIGGITSRVQPGQGAEFGAFCRALSGWIDTDRMATVVGRRRSRHVTPELPGLSIELSGVSGKPRDQVVPAAEARVTADAARVECAGRSCQLYPGDVSSTLFIALSLPCLIPVPFAAGRRHTPRVVIDDVVVQRRRWVSDGRAGGGAKRGEAGFRAAAAWRRELGLPDRVYLRHPDEPKPLLIDFHDPFGVADLNRLRPARMTCTEVLPELADTWWREDGPQPAELRIPVFLRWNR